MRCVRLPGWVRTMVDRARDWVCDTVAMLPCCAPVLRRFDRSLSRAYSGFSARDSFASLSREPARDSGLYLIPEDRSKPLLGDDVADPQTPVRL